MEYPTDRLFSRQQLQTITGVPDDVLGYWLKEGLLVPEPAEGRKHRRFRFIQLNIAAVLDAMRSLGANISVLRAFASKMQRGVELAAANPWNSEQLRYAAYLAKSIQQYRKGELVKIWNPEWLKAPPTSEARRDIPPHLVATSEDDIIADKLDFYAGCELKPAVPFALSLSSFDADALFMFDDLTGPEYINNRIENYEWTWIAWLDPSGEARFVSGEGGNINLDDRPATAAFWLSVSKLVRRLWVDNAHS